MEKTVKVKFDTPESVKDFVSIVTGSLCDMELKHDRYVVNAKSILGIFSLNLNNTLDLVIHGEEKQVGDIVAKLGSFVVE